MIRRTLMDETEWDRMLTNTRIRCVYMHVAQPQDRWESQPHTHQYHELCFVVKGAGVYNIDAVEYSMNVGNVFLLPRGIAHGERGMDGAPYELRFIMVEHIGERAHELDARLFSRPRRMECDDAAMHALWDRLVEELIEHEDGYLAVVEAYLRQIYVRLLRGMYRQTEEKSRKQHPAHAELPEKIRRMMEIDGEMDVTAEALAERLHYHPKYLSALIRGQTGMTLFEFLTHVRLENACDLLIRTNHTVLDITELCGFHNASHFFRAFKAAYGVTPARYRKRLRNAPRDAVVKL